MGESYGIAGNDAIEVIVFVSYVQEQALRGVLLLIIFIYVFPLSVLSTVLACIIILLHDPSCLSF